jgi:ABC-2 type transport system permease protein
MQPTQPISLVEYLSPVRLVGPLTVKELRVASRKRKYYLLRFAYVCLLALVTMQFWYVATHIGGGGSAVVQMSRLGEAGKTIIVTIIWFQFLTGQMLAAVLLSDAVSSEIRRRTLESLLATPIGAVHIVLGKLLSRLVQLLLLLAISLPVLALVRVFGGVPWDYVVAGVCVTLSGSIFAGSLSLLCSITNRHAHQAVLAVVVWYLVVWGILTWVLMGLAQIGLFSFIPTAFILSLTNPFAALLARTQALFRGPGGANAAVPVLWHCLTILALAAVMLALSVWKVRRAALAGPAGVSREAKARAKRDARARRRGMSQPIRRVKGAPIVWKELCTPLFQARRQIVFYVVLWGAVAAFIIVVVAFFGPRVHGSFFIPITILQWLLVIRLGVAAASAVTREKEAHTWAILLATPLSDGEILKGKLIAAFRRNLALLIPLLVLYVLVVVLGPRHRSEPVWLVLFISASLVGSVVFLLGVGVYLSTRLKTTAGAVASTLAVYVVPKLSCCGVPGPLFLLAPGGSGDPVARMFAAALVFPVIYVVAGLLCMRAALRRLRRNVF